MGKRIKDKEYRINGKFYEERIDGVLGVSIVNFVKLFRIVLNLFITFWEDRILLYKFEIRTEVIFR